MSQQPIITFKAGRCEVDTSSKPLKIRPDPTPGYLYLYNEDDLVHFCWRSRTTPLASPDLDLMMVPTDGTFQPFLSSSAPKPAQAGAKCPIPGRVFVLKFSSSGERHFFWLQSREQPAGEKSRFSARDLRLGEVVDELLQGGREGVEENELEDLRHSRSNGGGGGGGDGGPGGDEGDTAMEDVTRIASGGAGADATGGDVREEGEESREGGADGGRAPTDTSNNTSSDAALRQLLASIGTGTGTGASSTSNPQNTTTQQRQDPYTTLPDLLPSSITTHHLAHLSSHRLTQILSSYLPASLLSLAHDSTSSTSAAESQDPVALVNALTDLQKRDLLARVLRSPQFTQGVAGVDRAVRSGGLEGISEALGVRLDEGQRMSGAQGGGAAVKAFAEGVRKSVDEEESKREGQGGA